MIVYFLSRSLFLFHTISLHKSIFLNIFLVWLAPFDCLYYFRYIFCHQVVHLFPSSFFKVKLGFEPTSAMAQIVSPRRSALDQGASHLSTNLSVLEIECLIICCGVKICLVILIKAFTSSVAQPCALQSWLWACFAIYFICIVVLQVHTVAGYDSNRCY